jgi:hypothetical protein
MAELKWRLFMSVIDEDEQDVDLILDMTLPFAPATGTELILQFVPEPGLPAPPADPDIYKGTIGDVAYEVAAQRFELDMDDWAVDTLEWLPLVKRLVRAGWRLWLSPFPVRYVDEAPLYRRYKTFAEAEAAANEDYRFVVKIGESFWIVDDNEIAVLRMQGSDEYDIFEIIGID